MASLVLLGTLFSVFFILCCNRIVNRDRRMKSRPPKHNYGTRCSRISSLSDKRFKIEIVLADPRFGTIQSTWVSANEMGLQRSLVFNKSMHYEPNASPWLVSSCITVQEQVSFRIQIIFKRSYPSEPFYSVKSSDVVLFWVLVPSLNKRLRTTFLTGASDACWRSISKYSHRQIGSRIPLPALPQLVLHRYIYRWIVVLTDSFRNLCP